LYNSVHGIGSDGINHQTWCQKWTNKKNNKTKATTSNKQESEKETSQKQQTTTATQWHIQSGPS